MNNLSLNSKGGFQQSSDIIVFKAFNIAYNTSPVEKYHVSEGIHNHLLKNIILVRGFINEYICKSGL